MTAATDLPDPATTSRRRALLVVLVAAAVGLFLLARFRSVFGPLLIATALAYVLEPVVQVLVRRGLRRSLAVHCVFGVVVLAGLLVAGVLVLQAKALVDWLTADDGRVLTEVPRRFLKLVEGWLSEETRASWEARLAALQDPARIREFLGPAVTVLRGLGTGLITVFSALGLIVLLPVYLFYLMHELPRVWAWVVARLPARQRETHLRVLNEIHAGMSGFLRGYLTVALLKGAFLAIGLLVLGVRFAPIVGIASGLLSIVPFVGAMLGYLAAVVLALVAEQAELSTVLWITGLYVVAEVVEGLVLVPMIMKRGVGLHPLTILVSVLFWGAALSLFGALVAIPLTIVLKAVLKAYVLPSVDRLATG